MTKKSNIEALIESFEEQQKTFREKMEVELKKTFVEFFKEVPQCTAVIWTQYSPYFNDGDECVFYVHSATFTNCPVESIDEDIDCGEYIGEEEGIWTYGDDCYGDDPPRELVPAFVALDRLIQSKAMRGIFESIFGNHVKVTATAEGFQTTNYDHD